MLKRTLGLSLVALVALAAAGPAAGQGKYPTRPIEVVVPYAPGGGTDILMRTIVAIIDENKWSPRPVTVMNRAGGSGAVGYTYLISQKGNPHTVAGATPMVVSGKVQGRLPGNHRDAMTILMIVAIDELMLSVRTESPHKTIDDFVKAARANAGKLTIGGTGTNTEDHIFTHLFEQAAGIKVKYVPFNSGGEVTAALMGGHVDALNNKVWDVGQMLAFGVLGYAMKRLDYSPAALTLALVLGPLAERALRQSMILSDAGLLIFFQRPIAAVLTSLALAAVAVPLARALGRAVAERR